MIITKLMNVQIIRHSTGPVRPADLVALVVASELAITNTNLELMNGTLARLVKPIEDAMRQQPQKVH